MSSQTLPERLPEDVAVRPRDLQLHASGVPPPGAVPIDKLSTEVFVAIMLIVRDYWYDRKRSHNTAYRWLHATGVCRRWRSVMLGAPSLWTRITFGEKIKLPLLFVQRSGEAPVDLRFYGASSSIRVETHWQVVSVVVAVQHRIRRLTLGGLIKSACNQLVLGLTSAMPLLEELRLYASEYSPGDTLLVESAPRLSRISVTGIAWLWNCAPLSNLTKLELTCIERRLPFNTICDIIKESPMLECLVLGRSVLHMPVHEDSSSQILSHIRLECLKKLVLANNYDILLALLERITFPAAASIDLSLIQNARTEAGHYNAYMLSDLLPPSEDFLPSLERVDRVLLSCSPSCLRIRVYADKAESRLLDIKLTRVNHNVNPIFMLGPALNDLMYFFADSPVHSLIIDSHFDTASFEEWWDILSTFPLLEHLEIGGNGNFSDLFDALGRHEESGSVLCPKLRELQIHDYDLESPCEEVCDLTDMLQARLAAGVPLGLMSLEEPDDCDARMSEADVQAIRTLVSDYRTSSDEWPVVPWHWDVTKNSSEDED